MGAVNVAASDLLAILGAWEHWRLAHDGASVMIALTKQEGVYASCATCGKVLADLPPPAPQGEATDEIRTAWKAGRSSQRS